MNLLRNLHITNDRKSVRVVEIYTLSAITINTVQSKHENGFQTIIYRKYPKYHIEIPIVRTLSYFPLTLLTTIFRFMCDYIHVEQKTYPSPQVILWCCGGALDIYWFLLSADYRHRKSVHYHFRRKYWAYIFVQWKKWCFGFFLLQITIITFVIVAKYLKL